MANTPTTNDLKALAEGMGVYDINGVPICPGDLLREFHFTGARRKRHYLYHVACLDETGQLEARPVSWLNKPEPNKGGRFSLTQHNCDVCLVEVIHGHGPGDCISYEDRPKRKPAVAIEALRVVEKDGE